MAFVPYIVIDGLQYKTPSKMWTPSETKPSTVRLTLAGALDATYGVGALCEWRGDVEAPAVATAPWGTVDQLIVSLRKKVLIAFQDHYQVSYSADISGQMIRRSLTPGWNSSCNKWYISVTIKAAA